MWRQPSSNVGLVGGRAAEHAHACVVDEDVDAAEAGDDVVDEPVDLRGVAHVHDVALRLTAGRIDLVHHGLDSVRPEVDNGDARAFVGEEVRSGAAHAAGRARDDRDLARDRAGELREPRFGHVRSGIGKWTPGRPCWLMLSGSGAMPG